MAEKLYLRSFPISTKTRSVLPKQRHRTGLSGIPCRACDVERRRADCWRERTHEALGTGAGFMASVAVARDREGLAANSARTTTSRPRKPRGHDAQPADRPGDVGGAERPRPCGGYRLGVAANLVVPGSGLPIAAGIMAGQSRGEEYEQLTGEGIKPTTGQLALATGIGAVQGVASELTGAA